MGSKTKDKRSYIMFAKRVLKKIQDCVLVTLQDVLGQDYVNNKNHWLWEVKQ